LVTLGALISRPSVFDSRSTHRTAIAVSILERREGVMSFLIRARLAVIAWFLRRAGEPRLPAARSHRTLADLRESFPDDAPPVSSVRARPSERPRLWGSPAMRIDI
jgi:hypothetical protein